MGVTIEQWTAALRSGEYKQGKHYLRTQNKEFCCLGVLCDLYDRRGWTENPVEFFDDGEENAVDVGAYGYTPDKYNQHQQTPPEDVMNAVGLNNEMCDYLAQHNDAGATFAEIATMIESGLDTLKAPVYKGDFITP